MLKAGKKYNVMAVYDGKYLVTKSIDWKEVRLIGPVKTEIKELGGVYIKSKDGLELLK